MDPRERFAEDSTGPITDKVTPLNADNVILDSGEWVWHFRAPRGIRVGDSTGIRTLMIRIDSPVASTVVSFRTYAVHVTSTGWTLLTWNTAWIDTTKLVQRPGTHMIMYRTAFMLRFKDGVSDSAKQVLFREKKLVVQGVEPSGVFHVAFADPGPSIEVYDRFKADLRAHPAIKSVVELYHSGGFIEQ